MHYGGCLEALGPSFILSPLKLGGPTRLRLPLSLSPFRSLSALAPSVFHRLFLLVTSLSLSSSHRIIPRIIERAADYRREERERERGTATRRRDEDPRAFAPVLLRVSIRILVCGFYFKHRAHRDSHAYETSRSPMSNSR